MVISIRSVQDELPSGFSNCSLALMSLIVSRCPEIEYWSIVEFYDASQSYFELGYFVSFGPITQKSSPSQHSFRKFPLNSNTEQNDVFEFFTFNKNPHKSKAHTSVLLKLNQCVTPERRFKGLSEPVFKDRSFRYKNSLGLWCSSV